MTGTHTQIEWAEEIRIRVNADFDRVAAALHSAAAKQTGEDRAGTHAIAVILEEKRVEVMARDEAGYFIKEWQELGDQVRRLLIQDSRYQELKRRRVARRKSASALP